MSAAGTRPARTDSWIRSFVCVTHSHAGALTVVLGGLTAAGRRLKGQKTKAGGGGGGRESTLNTKLAKQKKDRPREGDEQIPIYDADYTI